MVFVRSILARALGAAFLLATSACAGGSGTPAQALTSQNAAPVMLYPASAGGSIATPSPVGTLTQNVAFTAAGSQAYILAYQSGFTGTFTVASACQTPSQPTGATGVATAAFGVPTGPGAVLTITAGSTGGNCVFTITGASSKTATVFVGNTVTTGNVN